MLSEERLSLRGSASIAPDIIDDLFMRQIGTPQSAAPPSQPTRILVSNPQRRVDAFGQKFAAHTLNTQCSDGGQLQAERRYTEFAALHEEIYAPLALRAAFPVPQTSLLAWVGVGTPREEQLQQYMDRLLDSGARRHALPALSAFCRRAPFVVVGSPAATCVANLPTAAPWQCLAMMRAHPTNDAVLGAGACRLLELARPGSSEGVGAALVDAGAVEFLCAALRRKASESTFKPASAVAAVITTSPSTRSLPSINASSNAPNKNWCGTGNPASSMGSDEPDFAADAVGVLAALATEPTSRPADVRALLSRCGANELLTALMKAQPYDHTVQAACASLLAALVATNRASPPGVASHYEFEAVALVCQALHTHRSRLNVQWQCAATLHALACRSVTLAESVVRHDGVRLLCKAMSTYRSDTAARMQASVCGTIAALADHVPSCREQLASFSAGPLICQTLADFLSASDGGSAVFVCGARALLTLSDLPPASTALVGSSGLEELMWSAAALHTARPVAQGVCCEIVAALTRERLRLAADGVMDWNALHKAGSIPRAAKLVAGALAQHGAEHPLDVACAAMAATRALLQLNLVASLASRAASDGSTGGQQLVPASDLESLEVEVERAVAGASLDDPMIPSLATSVREEFERCRHLVRSAHSIH
jgi:hypothetical protein